MRYKLYILLTLLGTLFYSCSNCEILGDYNLGGEFSLFSGDKDNESLIIYCSGRDNINGCCTGGTSVIPSLEDKEVQYVDGAIFDQRWIIAKSIGYNNEISYWIIDKDFDTNWEYDDGGIFYNRIQSHITGPLKDKEKFEYELIKLGIALRFKG